MEEDKKYSDMAEEWLDEYVSAEKEIDREIERLEYLTSKMTSINAQVMTGMPRSTNASTDRMADKMSQTEELEEAIREVVLEQARKRKEIEAVIRKLRNTDERAVIRLRYLDRVDWGDILEIMFGMNSDFNDRYDTYRRRMYRHREVALVNIGKLLVEANTAVPAN